MSPLQTPHAYMSIPNIGEQIRSIPGHGYPVGVETAAEQIRAWAIELGFAAVGFSRATRVSDRDAEALDAWLDTGKHGEMTYLDTQRQVKKDPSRVLAGAKSVIVVLDAYATRQDPSQADTSDESGRIARYARGRDYHKTLKRRLYALSDRISAELSPPRAEDGSPGVRSFVDTAPVMERQLAARAGLGAIGKHTLLIHPRWGSWFFLGGILTTLELPAESRVVPDLCGGCTKCIDACPTGAIKPYSVDATRCISYLTIEHRSDIDPEVHGAMRDAGYVFGCDICQEVCPHNQPLPASSARVTSIPESHDAYTAFEDAPDRVRGGQGFDLLKVLGWSEADRQAAVQRSSMKRAKLWMFKRNAAILAGKRVPATPSSESDERNGVDVDNA